MIPYLLDDLKSDEGYAKALPDGGCQSYPDPKTGCEPWTIGYGATGDGIGEHTIWTRDQAETDLARRAQQIEGQLDHALPWWRGLGAVRAAVVANMAYNLGITGLQGFHKTLTAMQAGDFAEAATEMLWNKPNVPTQWHIDVGRRAVRLADEMRTGIRHDAPPPAPRTLTDAAQALHGPV